MWAPRLSLLSALGLVFLASLASIELRLAVEGNHGPLTGLVVALLLGASILVVVFRGGPRATALGAALAGGIYFAAVRIDPIGIPTARWIVRIHDLFLPPPSAVEPGTFAPYIQQIFDAILLGHLLITLFLMMIGAVVAWGAHAAILSHQRSGFRDSLQPHSN